MATYKVLQDIEAEDKLLGPLTLKQFIFAVVTLAFCGLAVLFAQIHIILATPWLIRFCSSGLWRRLLVEISQTTFGWQLVFGFSFSLERESGTNPDL